MKRVLSAAIVLLLVLVMGLPVCALPDVTDPDFYAAVMESYEFLQSKRKANNFYHYYQFYSDGKTSVMLLSRVKLDSNVRPECHFYTHVVGTTNFKLTTTLPGPYGSVGAYFLDLFINDSGYGAIHFYITPTILNLPGYLFEDLSNTTLPGENLLAEQGLIVNSTDIQPPELPDTTELKETLVEAKTIEDIGYTQPSWTTLQTAIQEGDTLLAQPTYTPPEVKTATVNLKSGINGLKLVTTPPVNPPVDPPSEPSGHRYLIDGFRVEDLLPAQTAIFENFFAGQKFGLYLFGVMLAVMAVVKIIKRFSGFSFWSGGSKDDRRG